MKPLRTALFVPGNRPDRAAKALGLAADAVILDLEDAVPIAEKEKTRALVRDVLESSSEKRVYVRVNGLSTPYCKEDLEAELTGIAAFEFEGNLIDYPMLERAKRICALAQTIS